MKSIIAIIVLVFVATFTFANETTPAKGNVQPNVVIADDETPMTAAMDAALMMVINNTATVNTMDKATVLTLNSNDNITVSSRFAVHTFTETTTSNDIAPVATAMEVIELDAEEL
jgi:hypothetical protein